ncbi:MAG: SDR family oxidoreductase [Kiritimatiellia bacterium]|jgi:NAD(P)-dependent dehydrogenase (short-subunit alcohol dehydrogenase family)|nr:SDR family oxidoreductase [Pseudomonadales bacterium]MDP6469934.1 SDR family oxidoreductase [Pseudomonadales bacterium]MDP6828954.1 SDR family oxidoreductase [Pseudomonadales bacterium]MDP7024659.1 SDR family oxidoreductase [Kiritimatiellia bacterium]
MSLKGRVAIITGGNRGIGRGIALGLAEDGADIAVNYRRDEEGATETVGALRNLGVRAQAYQASVDDYEAVREMVAAVAADFSHIDILVNNAGIASRGNSVADTDPAEFERVVRTHCFGSFYTTHEVIPHLRERPRGDIIMISSAGTRRWAGNGAPYNVGKAGIEAIANGVAKEELRNNIRVNIVAPGLVETEMGRRLARATRGVENLRDIDDNSPFGHVCQPEDVANVVRYLVSDLNSYVTGERIYVDGLAGEMS